MTGPEQQLVAQTAPQSLAGTIHAIPLDDPGSNLTEECSNTFANGHQRRA